ncbi:MAG: protein translocase subunit SecD [Chloroflexi bacterium]|nr:protein translocase subunit SecD [Chloroflexota bacterium]MQG05823.1 protein translocase subunit SecD [SAR202 cluster bacterium]
MTLRRFYKRIAIISALLVIAISSLTLTEFKIGQFERGGNGLLGLELGLDLQGGSHLVYQAVDSETGEPIIPRQEQMDSLKQSIERRVNASGLGEPIIQLLGDNRLLIQLPGVRDTKRAKSLIGETAQLNYKERTLNVARKIPGIEPGSLLNVSAIDLNETITDVTTNQSTLSNTSSSPMPANLQPLPGLLLEFSDEGAIAFSNLLTRLETSILPLEGTNDRYPSYLTIQSDNSTEMPLQISYRPLLMNPTTLEWMTSNTAPLINKADSKNSFIINLSVQYASKDTDSIMESFTSEFGGSPETIQLGEIIGRVDQAIPGGLTGEDMDRAFPGQHQTTNLPIINIVFNDEGARKFGEITTKLANTPDLLVIELDGQELIASRVINPITNGAAYIEGGDFTYERVQDLALLLESGRLPLPINLIQERTVDAILGSDSLKRSLVAGLIGLGLILLFMILYYRMSGVIAAIALIIYATLLLGIFKLLPVTLTLSGIAAAILSIGMAVDANILIFERMKEELRYGRTVPTAINIGFNRAWSAIRDSNISTLITCGVLFWFADTLGASIVKGFAITLAIGVLISMFSAITVTKTILQLLGMGILGKKPMIFTPFSPKSINQKNNKE